MILPRKALPLLAGVAVAAGAIVPVGATAAKMPNITTKYTYKVTLKGVQTSTWSLSKPDRGVCNSAQSGKGKQTIRFSAKPQQVYMYDGISPTMFVKKKDGSAGTLKMNLRGSVTRNGSVVTAPLPPEEYLQCPDGEPTAPPTPDCGTKKLKGLVVEPEWAFKSDLVTLNQADAYDAPEAFKHCPFLGEGYPYLIAEDDNGKEIGQELPTKDLFANGQNIIIARGTKTLKGEDVTSTNKIRWELEFKLVKKEKVGK